MVIIAMIIGFTALIMIVIPRFINLYGRFKAELPFPTRVLIAIHHMVSHYWWLLLIIFIILYYQLNGI
jgi:type II secretory pathway component PulF